MFNEKSEIPGVFIPTNENFRGSHGEVFSRYPSHYRYGEETPFVDMDLKEAIKGSLKWVAKNPGSLVLAAGIVSRRWNLAALGLGLTVGVEPLIKAVGTVSKALGQADFNGTLNK
jgi:hypothetical protein